MTWKLEMIIGAQAAPGSILMGNRETPGHKTTFFKVTPERGVQLYKDGRALLRIPAKFPRGKWVQIRVEKRGKDFSVFCDEEEIGSAVLREAVTSMPCYLGGDPLSGGWTRGQIRAASVQ